MDVVLIAVLLATLTFILGVRIGCIIGRAKAIYEEGVRISKMEPY